jgi:hypothetical protein
LEQISGLSNTLNSVAYDTNTVSEKPHIFLSTEKLRNLYKAQSNNLPKKLNECSTTGGGDVSSSLSNLEKSRNSKQRGCKVDVLMK